MRNIINLVELFSRAVTGIAFAVLMGSVLIQVFGRSIFADSPIWTEELTRFALLFVAAFGAGLSYKSGDLVNVDLICEGLPGRWPRRMRLFSALATAALMFFLILPAWKFTSIGAMQTSPALSWRMDFIHVSVLVMMVSLFIFSALRAVSMMLGLSDGHPQPNGEADQ
jgi:TRAP-type transport system small permease protein